MVLGVCMAYLLFATSSRSQIRPEKHANVGVRDMEVIGLATPQQKSLFVSDCSKGNLVVGDLR